jgi:ABC-2 type transport system permease protein
MDALIHIELYKLRTVRAPLLLLAVSQLVIIGGVSGLVISGNNLRDPKTISQALAHAGLVSLLTLVLGIMAVAGEYRNKTITDTYLSTPRRGRVVQAKLYASAIAGAAFGIVNAITALITAYLWWAAKGVPFDLSGTAVWHTIAGCFAWNIAFAVIGVGIGALVRNLTAAIAAALAWIALVEGIVGQLVGGLAKWLPFASGSALGDMTVAGSTVRPLPQVGAGLVLAGYAALFAVVAVSTTVRRDVS